MLDFDYKKIVKEFFQDCSIEPDQLELHLRRSFQEQIIQARNDINKEIQARESKFNEVNRKLVDEIATNKFLTNELNEAWRHLGYFVCQNKIAIVKGN